MLEPDRKQAGWSVGQAAWRLGVSVREYFARRSPSTSGRALALVIVGILCLLGAIALIAQGVDKLK
jgi:hypothetical protein